MTKLRYFIFLLVVNRIILVFFVTRLLIIQSFRNGKGGNMSLSSTIQHRRPKSLVMIPFVLFGPLVCQSCHRSHICIVTNISWFYSSFFPFSLLFNLHQCLICIWFQTASLIHDVIVFLFLSFIQVSKSE